MRERRLPPGPAERIDRSRILRFHLDRRPMEAFPGDTIGSAMAAAGVRITARSFKYHRPRGLLCMTGDCPNCLCDVDGVPNVRACTEPVREGMEVLRQNAWPSVDRDVARILDRFGFMMPAGFYYKIFQRPRFAWPMVEPIIRRFAGRGRAPSHGGPGLHRPGGDGAHRRTEKIHRHLEVLVIGGGPAGLAAAVEAVRAGASTLLIEQAEDLGGTLLASTQVSRATAAWVEGLPGHAAAGRLAAAARDAGVEVLTGTPAIGVFDGPLVAAAGGDALYRIRPERIVFATGAVEQPAVFPNNDLPGILLAGAVDRLVQRYRILPGQRAVVAAFGPEAYVTAATLAEAGASVTVLDPGSGADPGTSEARAFASAGGTIVDAALLVGARGRRRVRGVTYLRGGDTVHIKCDLLVVGGVLAPTTNLLAQAGARVAFDDAAQAFLAQELPPEVFAAGRVTGARSLETVLAQGRLAGLEAARSLGRWGPGTDGSIAELRDLIDRVSAAEHRRVLPPARSDGAGKQFACLCMDVTDKEMRTAAQEGFDSIELQKRYTTVSMGPCQGRACLLSSIRVCASHASRTPGETGTPTARPPWTPVPLGVLAGPDRTPRKEGAINDRHADAGAEFMWAGDWRRPHHYTDPREECRAVHERVGVIDVSTLGKLRVEGPDAAAFLERLYPNRFADLAVGRIRYGVMLNDAGVILDDGTVCRLTDDEFFVTTTTGGTEAMEMWMEWWLADWEMDVRILNVSGAFAAVNVAGPRSRALMERLTDVDVSAEALPYLRSARGDVAGVPSLILRIGFVGELGYEVHFPSAYGEHVWDSILAAGADLGVLPFGLEAQRILRLEKQHILVGQDTDALSDPFGAGMAWIVKGDKGEFLGKRALAELKDAPPPERLVGFSLGHAPTPPEGAAVVDDGRWVGRVTSSRRSPQTGEVIGMAWVPSAWAEEGRGFDVKFDGFILRATVTLHPFYDPDGARLRS